MRLAIDTNQAILSIEMDGHERTLPLHSREAFELLSQQWVNLGWNLKYGYTFSWLGRPIIQLPEDMVRIQEVIYAVKPDFIVETGVAHGGSLVFYASLCHAMGQGHVIGIDIDIRPANRAAIEAHAMARYITLIEGDSTEPELVAGVRAMLPLGKTVLVILDSCHEKAHVRRELDCYAGLVTGGSYIVVTDGVMQDLHDVPRGQPSWREDNPAAAAREFALEHPEFVLEPPAWPFNESALHRGVTHWPDAWLRRRAD
jgi:cephalosporin hydroxylase